MSLVAPSLLDVIRSADYLLPVMKVASSSEELLPTVYCKLPLFQFSPFDLSSNFLIRLLDLTHIFQIYLISSRSTSSLHLSSIPLPTSHFSVQISCKVLSLSVLRECNCKSACKYVSFSLKPYIKYV